MTTFAKFDDIGAFERYLKRLPPGSVAARASDSTSCPLAVYARDGCAIEVVRVDGRYLHYRVGGDRIDPLARWQVLFIDSLDSLAMNRAQGGGGSKEFDVTREECLDVLYRTKELGYGR